MVSLVHIESAIAAVDHEVKTVLHDMSLSLTEKDQKMLPLLRESKVLKQAYEDLQYLKANPPSASVTCKVGSYKEGK